jgi:hypothetical protein
MNYLSFQFLDDYALDNSFNSDPLLLFRAPDFNIQLKITGSPVGTLKLQSSADVTMDPTMVSTWADIPDSSLSVNGAGILSWKVLARYKWVRVSYLAASGSGTCDATLYAIEELR